MFKFKLGDQVRDTKNGCIGVIFARAEYAEEKPLRYLVEAIDTIAWWWADEDQLELCYGE